MRRVLFVAEVRAARSILERLEEHLGDRAIDDPESLRLLSLVHRHLPGFFPARQTRPPGGQSTAA